MEFIGLKDTAKDVVENLKEVESDSSYSDHQLRKWKMSDGYEDVGEVNEVVQLIEDDKIYTCLEFKYFDKEEKPVYVFEWEHEEV
ncbi:MAG: hypothetical protein ACOCRO_09605 [Halanaerobiales bacterium]